LVPADGVDEDALVLVVAEAGAEDVELDGSSFVVTSEPDALSAVRVAVEAAGFAIESVELAMVPKVTVTVGDEGVARQLIRLVEGLEDTDDVQDVYANFDIPERMLEAVAS
jgi:transcriptional/translational regulatory protein YebC/TACO1